VSFKAKTCRFAKSAPFPLRPGLPPVLIHRYFNCKTYITNAPPGLG